MRLHAWAFPVIGIALVFASALCVAISLAACSPSSDVTTGGDAVSTTDQGVATTGDAQTTTDVKTDADGAQYVADEMIVVFKQGTTPDEAMAALSSAKSVVAQKVTQDQLDQSLALVTVKVADGHTVDEAISELEQCDVVESAQKNHVLHTMA